MKKSIKITIAIVVLGLYLISMISMASALVINSVSMNPREIAPGETSVIKIKLENNAKDDITEVSVELDLSGSDLPFAPYDSSSEDSFDEIKDDDEETAQFKIIALNDAKSGIYKIPVIITYYDANETKQTKNSLISITVNSEPIIGANVEDGLLLKEQENEISIKIVNKGLSDVKFLEVELGTSTYYNLLSGENVYIGDVDSDDFDSAEFKVYFKENIPGLITLPVMIIYKDALNNKYIEDFDLQVKVYTKKQAIELGLLERSKMRIYAGVVIAVIVVWIFYRKIKKRRKMKRAKENKGEF